MYRIKGTTSTMIRTLCLLAFVVVSLGLASPAHASPPGSNELLGKAVTLFKAKQYRKALSHFMEAYIEQQDPNIVYNIARCHEELGEIDDAVIFFKKFVEISQSKEGKAEAMKKVEKLLLLKDKGILVLTIEPTSATLAIDGKDRGEGPFEERAFYLAGGVHLVKVTAAGFAPYEKQIVLAEKEKKPLTVALADAKSVVVTPPPGDTTDPVTTPPTDPTPPPTVGKKGPSAFGIWPWVIGGGAVVLAGTGVGLYMSGVADRDEVRDATVDGVVSDISMKKAQQLDDSASSKQVTAYVLYGVAGLMAAGAVTMLVLDMQASPSSPSTSVSFLPLPGGGVVGLTTTF